MIMKVKKRNGSLQDFNINKVRLTLGRVSDELDKPFTGADLRLLTEAIEESIIGLGKEIVESRDIYRIVVEKLKGFGFDEIAKAYSEYERSF